MVPVTIVPQMVKGELRIRDMDLGGRFGFVGPKNPGSDSALVRGAIPERCRKGISIATKATAGRQQKMANGQQAGQQTDNKTLPPDPTNGQQKGPFTITFRPSSFGGC